MILSPEKVIQEFTAQGYWGEETLVDMLYARAGKNPDKVALVDPLNKKDLVGLEPSRLTYAELISAIDRLALRFIELGVKRDDIILAQLPNTLELTTAIFAAARVGAIISPIPLQWRSHEIRHAASLTKARLFICPHVSQGMDYVELVNKALDGTGLSPQIMTVSADKAPGALLFSDPPSDRTADPSLLDGKQSGPNDVFTLCWTSGTEAEPKAVPRSHNHWIYISRVVVQSFLPDQECVYLSLFPTINMAGFAGVMIPWVITGGKMVLHHPFDLVGFLKQLVLEKVYYTLAPPALLDNLAKSPQWAAMDKGDLRVIGSGSAPLSPWMVKTFQDDFGIGIVNFFGSNEGVALYSSPKDFPNPEDRARFFPRFGVEGFNWYSDAVKGLKTRLTDPGTEQEITEPDVVGELRIAGPAVFPGYYNAPEITAKAFDDQGYFRTGDLFSITGDNNDKYAFQGRYKDLIIRGGVNISPEEIETLVVEHPDIVEAAAVGYPDERLGERICIVATPVKGKEITLEDINEFLRKKDIAKYKYPEVLRLVESLPRSPVGKVLKRKIREELEKDYSG